MGRFDNIGDAVALLCKRRGWTQSELARRAKIRPALISRYKALGRMRQVPDLETVAKVVDALDISLAELEDVLDEVNHRPRRNRGGGEEVLGGGAIHRYLGAKEDLPDEIRIAMLDSLYSHRHSARLHYDALVRDRNRAQQKSRQPPLDDA